MRISLALVVYLIPIAAAVKRQSRFEDEGRPSWLAVAVQSRQLKGKKSSSAEQTHQDIFAESATASPAHSPTQPVSAPTRHPTYEYPSSSSGKKSSSSGPGSSSSGKGKKGSNSAKKLKKKTKSNTQSMSMKNGKGTSQTQSPVASPSSSSTSKGNGKGGVAPSLPPNMAPTPMPVPLGCESMVARRLSMVVPELITQNPPECCTRVGPTAVYVTHAQSDSSTQTGFEPFWDDIFFEIAALSSRVGACFVMTGYNQTFTPARSVADILVSANLAASMITDVPAMMSTDPTSDVALINTIRAISSNPDLPSIGVFNAGYPNVIVEAIVSGLDRLPYVGILRDSDYGELAGQATTQLLNGTAARPLCFNARPALTTIGVRCGTYYDEVTETAISPATGVTCSASTTVDTFVGQLTAANANAALAHGDCCTNVAGAAQRLRALGRPIVVGCTDEGVNITGVNYTTTQPIQLQAYQSSSWVNLPVQVAEEGKNGRGTQFFPSLQSLVNTGVFNIINT